jgi:glycerol uptake facilitator protein
MLIPADPMVTMAARDERGRVALPGSCKLGGGVTFSDHFWIPIIGPLIGGVLGVIIYDLSNGDVLHARPTT